MIDDAADGGTMEALQQRSRRFKPANVESEAPVPLAAADDDHGHMEDEEDDFAPGSACIVGTLMTMCSEDEIRRRDEQMDVHLLEAVRDESAWNRSTRRADPNRMIKKYQRSAAGTAVAVPSEVRPPAVLAKTIVYMLSELLDTRDAPQVDVYNFFRDRFRAIRKDFALQDKGEAIAVTAHEQIARFFILSHHELCEEKEDDFQKYQNLQQIAHTITSLNHYYKDIRLRGGYQAGLPTEAEFCSYQILLNMRDANKLNDHLMNLPAHVRTSETVKVARNLASSFRGQEYARFFKLLRTCATYLQRCCVHSFLWDFRSRSLCIIMNSLAASATYPVASLRDLLAFDDDMDAVQFCTAHGLTVDNGEIHRRSTPTEMVPRVEWKRSRVLIGPPTPSKLAVIVDSSTNPLADQVRQLSSIDLEQELAESRRLAERQEAERRRREAEAARIAAEDAERRSREEAARRADAERVAAEHARRRIVELDRLASQTLSRFAKARAKRFLQMWVGAVRVILRRRSEAHLRSAQLKFHRERHILQALTRASLQFAQKRWLYRWRLAAWRVRRDNAKADLFVLHKAFGTWRTASLNARRERKNRDRFVRLLNQTPAPVSVPNLNGVVDGIEGMNIVRSPGAIQYDALASTIASARGNNDEFYFHLVVSVPEHVKDDLGRDALAFLQLQKQERIRIEEGKLHVLITPSTCGEIVPSVQGVLFVQSPSSDGDRARHRSLLSSIGGDDLAIPTVIVGSVPDVRHFGRLAKVVSSLSELADCIAWQASLISSQPQRQRHSVIAPLRLLLSALRGSDRSRIDSQRSWEFVVTWLNRAFSEHVRWPPVWAAPVPSLTPAGSLQKGRDIVSALPTTSDVESACELAITSLLSAGLAEIECYRTTPLPALSSLLAFTHAIIRSPPPVKRPRPDGRFSPGDARKRFERDQASFIARVQSLLKR
ncbi:SAC3/GANP/THP3 conserved domain-containing protein [Plasmodiophora brassicae]|uniref:SAC3/GANP/THP3 conserved domain-containing protein n=1 Tax=Plasmodiophora brassicae TaxID=37360 RepID=A0A0G4IXB6_PLABS|nr:hypothetical protein PBRA_007626 [Plasmodiophora brassicae]